MSTQRTCRVTNSITFSQALEVGLTHYDWLHKTEDEIAGQEAVHASHSVLPESVEAQRTRDTFGPLFGGLSPSADLARSSGNRLRALTDLNGSPEYELTWSVWAMPFGEPIIRLRALGHRTGGSDCSGWPIGAYGTPRAQERPRSKEWLAGADREPTPSEFAEMWRSMAGWPTPNASDWKGANHSGSGSASANGVATTAALAVWATPNTVDAKGGTRNGKGQVQLCHQAKQVIGTTPSGSIAATEKRGVLNPALSAWLMGYPEEIIYCVDWETR
jgi:hypothetical protein